MISLVECGCVPGGWLVGSLGRPAIRIGLGDLHQSVATVVGLWQASNGVRYARTFVFDSLNIMIAPRGEQGTSGEWKT